jgi:hypothetical protein
MRDPVSLCIAELMLTLICQFRGEVDRVGELAEKLVASATKQGLRYAAYALVLHGWALAARGKITIGIEKMQTGLTSYTSPAPGCSAPTFCGCWRRP